MASRKIDWKLPSAKPVPYSEVLIQTLDDEYIYEKIESGELADWSDDVIRWAYIGEYYPLDPKVLKEEYERLTKGGE